jgi:AraC-like DNA-binding protein
METLLPGFFHWPAKGLSAPQEAGHFHLRDRHFCTGYRLPVLALHLYGYAGEIRFPESAALIGPGDVTLTPPGIESRYHLPRGGSHFVLHIPVPKTDGPGLSVPLHLRLGRDATAGRERLVRIIDHVRRARGCPDGPAATAAAGATLELFAWLAERPAASPATHPGEMAVEAAAAALRLHPEQALRIRDLAAQVGLSPGHLARRFRARYGHTLARYQLIQRIGAAQALLACTAAPVAAIGRRVGLPDPHHFNKLFRRIAGCPPTAFRTAHHATEDRVIRLPDRR